MPIANTRQNTILPIATNFFEMLLQILLCLACSLSVVLSGPRDDHGNVSPVFTKLLGSVDTEIPCGMAVDRDRNVWITGSTDGDLDNRGSNGEKDIFLIKLDEEGTVVIHTR